MVDFLFMFNFSCAQNKQALKSPMRQTVCTFRHLAQKKKTNQNIGPSFKHGFYQTLLSNLFKMPSPRRAIGKNKEDKKILHYSPLWLKMSVKKNIQPTNTMAENKGCIFHSHVLFFRF